jgi:ABC-type phosphate transport system substrate-binding protein
MRTLLAIAMISVPLMSGTVGLVRDPTVPGTLAVVVHRSSTMDSLAAADLRKMFTGDLRTWPDSSPVVVIEQPNGSETERRTLRLLLNTTPDVYYRQLLQTEFQGKPLPTIKVLNSEVSAIRFVFNVPGAVAVVEAGAALAAQSQVKTLRVDGKLPGAKGYFLQ